MREQGLRWCCDEERKGKGKEWRADRGEGRGTQGAAAEGGRATMVPAVLGWPSVAPALSRPG